MIKCRVVALAFEKRILCRGLVLTSNPAARKASTTFQFFGVRQSKLLRLALVSAIQKFYFSALVSKPCLGVNGIEHLSSTSFEVTSSKNHKIRQGLRNLSGAIPFFVGARKF